MSLEVVFFTQPEQIPTRSTTSSRNPALGCGLFGPDGLTVAHRDAVVGQRPRVETVDPAAVRS